jgi:hypothetical protein
MIAGLILSAILYTGVGDGITDNTATFNSAVAQVCSNSTTRTLVLPPGHYRFGSPPAAIPCALNIQGEGKGVTWLIRDYSGQGGYFLKITGGQDSYGGGSIRDLSIYTSPNGTDGIAVWVLASPDMDPTVLSKNPHGLLIDNVQIGRYSTAGGTWAFGVYLDGSQNPGTGGTAPGIRAVAIRNTSVAVTTTPLYLYMAYGTRLTNIDCYAGGTSIGQTNSSNTAITSATCTYNGS